METQPDYGRRLIPVLVDERARNGWQQPFTSIPRSSDPNDGFVDISYRQFANAVNRCAWWMQRNLVRSQPSVTVAYTGPSDIRYGILTLAAIKTGFKLFLPSPRNSVTAHLELLGLLRCDTYLTPKAVPMVVQEVLSKRCMTQVTIPELDTLMDPEDPSPFPYEKCFEEARYETFVISHTSGSTGVPKIVEVTHGTFAAQDYFQTLPSQGAPPTILEIFKGIRMCLALPLFHAAAYFCFFSAPVYYNMTSVVVPPVPLTAGIVDAVHKYGNVQACCLPPSILVDISKNSAYIEHLKGMKFAMYGGGPLPKDAGDKIMQETGTMIFSLLGTTETMLLPLEFPNKEEWEYHRFSACLGAEFRHHWDDLYELVIVRDSRLDLSQAAFATRPGCEEFSPQDLYSKHPTKEGLWRYAGRTDDVIVFVNGEKLNPITMEGIIGGHPEVESALMFGTHRFQSGVLIEAKKPITSHDEAARLLESLWPFIERANQSCPAHGRIMKGMVSFTTQQKPMARAGKGTVQRGNTLKLYEDEIKSLYDSEGAVIEYLPAAISFTDQKALRTSLRNFMAGEMGLKIHGEEDDFFAAGLDSLGAINSVKRIEATAKSLGLENFHLSSKAIYTHPSVASLAVEIMALTAQQTPQRHG
ncbi:MAG: hypothetical protein Q9214_000832 [Letrouitia sp. 1 TL-2023]